MTHNPDRTMGERVAVIEDVVLRMEGKLDKHIETIEVRTSRLERAWAYTKGAFSLLGFLITGALTYFGKHR